MAEITLESYVPIFREGKRIIQENVAAKKKQSSESKWKKDVWHSKCWQVGGKRHHVIRQLSFSGNISN